MAKGSKFSKLDFLPYFFRNVLKGVFPQWEFLAFFIFCKKAKNILDFLQLKKKYRELHNPDSDPLLEDSRYKKSDEIVPEIMISDCSTTESVVQIPEGKFSDVHYLRVEDFDPCLKMGPKSRSRSLF